MANLAEPTQWNTLAGRFEGIDSLPYRQLVNELTSIALGDCAGLHILDLGGGSGAQAQMAIKQGAALVDVVDISPNMLELGKQRQARTVGQRGQIRFYLADATKPISHPCLDKESYDIVMANWLFDHARSLEDLRGMWSNITNYAKPGAKFLCTRAANIDAPSGRDGKYGLTIKNKRFIPGGFVYHIFLDTDPPFDFEATSMQTSCSGSIELFEEFGFNNIRYIDPEQTAMVKKDPGFWKLHVEDPCFVVEVANKAQ